MSLSGIRMLEEVGETGIKILVYLHRSREAKLTDLTEKANISNAAVYHALAVLEKEELIIERSEGKKRIFCLSEDGQTLAEAINGADKIFIDIKNRRLKRRASDK